MWLPHAALIPIYWNRAWPVRLPYPSSFVSTPAPITFGGFGLNARRFEQMIVGRIRSSILAKDDNDGMTTVVVKELDRLVEEQRGRIETIESEIEDVRRSLGRLWRFVESTDDDLADTATPRIKANWDRQVDLEASLQEANAILSQRRAIRDDVATTTARGPRHARVS